MIILKPLSAFSLDLEIYQSLHGDSTEEIFKKFFKVSNWNWINADGTLTRIDDPSKAVMWCSNHNKNVNEEVAEE